MGVFNDFKTDFIALWVFEFFLKWIELVFRNTVEAMAKKVFNCLKMLGNFSMLFKVSALNESKNKS